MLHLDLGNCKRKDFIFIFYRIAISCLIMMESHEVKKKYNQNYIKISHIYNFSLCGGINKAREWREKKFIWLKLNFVFLVLGARFGLNKSFNSKQIWPLRPISSGKGFGGDEGGSKFNAKEGKIWTKEKGPIIKINK